MMQRILYRVLVTTGLGVSRVDAFITFKLAGGRS